MERKELQTENQESMENKELRKFSGYLERIGRSDLENKITPETPYAYYSMETYGGGQRGGGGLGILDFDTEKTAKKIGMPSVFNTLFYPYISKQVITEDFRQETVTGKISPEELGFSKIGKTSVFTLIGGNFSTTELDVYEIQDGDVRRRELTEPNLGWLYESAKDSDHRLYQQIVLGFGGYKYSKSVGEKPPVTQLNESPTVFAALAELDDILKKEKDFEKAFAKIRAKTIYTNHTVVPAADATFSRNQYERFVFPNIESEDLKRWLRGIINDFGGALRLNMLALALAGKKNGVSKIHAEEASKVYRDHERKEVVFEAVTNGIEMERWGNERVLLLYREAGMIDDFGLPAVDYEAKIEALDSRELKNVKKELRKKTREYWKTRINQYDQPIEIPEDAVVFDWKRRITEYKRPGMVFENPDKLARILETKNAYLVMAGKAHQSDGLMQGEITRILNIIDQNPILKRRVHFVEDYDDELARALAQGADISLNTPRVKDESGHDISTEACGTSIWKDMLNHTLLISTSDGGMADPELDARKRGELDFEPSYFKISGASYKEEVFSLYDHMIRTADIVRKKNPEEYADAVKRQLKAYLPIMSGSRMERDYLNLAFPKLEK